MTIMKSSSDAALPTRRSQSFQGIIFRVKANLYQTSQWIASKLKRISGFWFYAILLFLAMTAAFNSQIWRMGFYYDDWEGVFLQKELFSFRQIWEYFLKDRPFSALVHWVYNPLLGASPVAWRILGQSLN